MPAASSPLPLLLLLLLAVAGAAGAAAAALGVSGGGQLWRRWTGRAAPRRRGGADCRAIQQGGACYDPPDLLAHASYAFNDYFLRAGGAPAAPAACDFSGAAALTALNPSHGSCVFPSSTSPKNGSFTGTTTYGPAGVDLSQTVNLTTPF
uniref:X8 domain-containing protein n=1 Tax=Leersia perrieri TaxID=77586 RepID=A0A0D9WQY8_9ORYZ